MRRSERSPWSDLGFTMTEMRTHRFVVKNEAVGKIVLEPTLE